MTESSSGDHIDVGNIQNAQGVAIGRQARAVVTGSVLAGGASEVDTEALRTVLKEFRAALGHADLPDDAFIAAQTAAGSALVDGVKSDAMNAETVIDNVKKTADVLKEANVAVEEGTSLWQSISKLAPVLGPAVVGGARAVAAWFGVALPI